MSGQQEKLDPVTQSIIDFAKRHGGYIQVRKRGERGDSYTYFWYENGKQKHRTFDSIMRPEFIKAEILRIQQDKIYQKYNMSSYLAEHRQKTTRTTIMELAAWFIEISMIERVPTKHEHKDYKLESVKATMAGYEYAANKLNTFLKDMTGSDKFYVESLTRDHVNKFKRWMIKKNLSPRLANNILRRLNKMFKKARYENKLKIDAFQDFEYIKEHKSESTRTILSLEEMKAIAESEYVIENPQLWIAWQIMRFTGMRGGDLYKMKRKWIDLRLENYRVYVAKRDGEVLTRPFHHDLIKYLKKYFTKYNIGPEDKLITEKWNKFHSAFRYSIARLYPDFKNVGTHTPRHSVAAYLRNDAKWDHEWIGFFLLHTGKDVTATYTHEHKEKLRGMINALPLDGGDRKE